MGRENSLFSHLKHREDYFILEDLCISLFKNFISAESSRAMCVIERAIIYIIFDITWAREMLFFFQLVACGFKPNGLVYSWIRIFDVPNGEADWRNNITTYLL